MAGAINRSYEAASVGWPFGAAEGRVSVTICGSGNGAHALAVVASVSGDVEVDWLAGSEERARLLRAGLSRGGLCSTGAVAARADRIRSVSADPAAVIPGADVVLMLVPAFAHGRVLRRIAPYLSEGTAVGCMPARGAFEFEATRVLGSWARERPTVFGLQTLPWSTRVTRPGELVHI